MEASNLPYLQVTDDEQNTHATALNLACRCASGLSLAALRQQSKTGRVDFFRVPFEQVTDLIATRKVFVHRGDAFVPKDALVSVLTAAYRTRLSRALVICAGRVAASVDELEGTRLAPIIASLTTRYVQ